MILLPGTKSTIADMKWLRESGLEAAVLKEAAAGTLIFGICGGYQMLGRRISDPEEVESAGIKEIAGMGLLDMETVFQGEKIQTQTCGTFSQVEGVLSCLNGIAYEGYEIHMGRSTAGKKAITGRKMCTAAISMGSSMRPEQQRPCWGLCAGRRDWILPYWARSILKLIRSLSMMW